MRDPDHASDHGRAWAARRIALPGVGVLGLFGVLGGCPGPHAPGGAQVAPLTIEVGQPGWLLSGVTASGDGATVFVSLSSAAAPPAAEPAPAAAASAGPAAPGGAPVAPAGPSAARTTITARRRGEPGPRWHTDLDGGGGPLVRAGSLVVAALGGTGGAAGLALRGEPGSVVVALDAATGAVAWKRALDATEWSVIAALAAAPDGVIVGGSFSGTLRIGDKVVSSGGRTDGFVARLTAAGELAWVVRVGGPGADAVQGVATAGARIAIAGTFAAGADLLGARLPPFDERSIAADGFVAELDPTGARRWVDTFGGRHDETVAGVAIDARGRIAVAGTIRETVHVGGADLVVNGAADGLVAWWAPDGTAGAQLLIGGSDFDGLRAIA
ncbi:MAG TPA: hypothetical protein VFT22_01345, partial [Kofleriaceae bacterium]|nr:hypothetical protein [Kofleriaceae bacterium]